jgi:non-canonical purine NTP pyrophosphatase (RdgB/HAM1 family)
MRKIIVATGNKHKLREIRHILRLPVSSSQLPVKENGRTFEANAIKKAKSIRLRPDEIAIADDSGLMVDCLGGKPGVKSARFATPPTPENLCRKLLRAMEKGLRIKRKRIKGRTAKFVCVIAVVYPSGKVRTVKGVCRGRIIHEMRGKRGFGYDPVFVPSGYKKTFAQMSPAMKNRLSHRGRALKRLKQVLR